MRLGLIVGTGELPEMIARHRRDNGEHVHVVAIRGFEEPWMADFGHDVCGIAELGKMLKLLKAQSCDTLAMIGNVKRPDFASIKADMKGMSVLPRIIGAARKGDDALLSLMVDIFEKEGLRVIGVQELLSDITQPAKVLTNSPISESLAKDIQRSFEVSGLMGDADIGQGSVVCEGLVLAVEAQEGTDEMLRRVSSLPTAIRGNPKARKGALVKRPKPNQERRVDLPTLGVSTVRLAGEAGLAAVCGVEHGALWVNETEMIDVANELGIALVSLRANGDLP